MFNLIIDDEPPVVTQNPPVIFVFLSLVLSKVPPGVFNHKKNELLRQHLAQLLVSLGHFFLTDIDLDIIGHGFGIKC